MVRESGDANIIVTRAMPVLLDNWLPVTEWMDAQNSNLKPTGPAGTVTRMMQGNWLAIDRGTYLPFASGRGGRCGGRPVSL